MTSNDILKKLQARDFVKKVGDRSPDIIISIRMWKDSHLEDNYFTELELSQDLKIDLSQAAWECFTDTFIEGIVEHGTVQDKDYLLKRMKAFMKYLTARGEHMK